jgi:hypothetical protein
LTHNGLPTILPIANSEFLSKIGNWEEVRNGMNERIFRRNFLFLLYAATALIFFIPSSNSSAYSAQVTLQWDPNEGEGERVAGYRVYYGTESGNYEKVLDVGHRTECEISGLEEGRPYFFAANAYDAAGLESDFSDEVGIYEIVLSPGWNLISLPLKPFDTSIGEVLKSISTNVYLVMALNNPNVLSYLPRNLAWSTLRTMEAGVGYWVVMYAQETLRIAGNLPPKSTELLPGLNLVGYSNTNAVPPSIALQGLDQKVVSVTTYEDGEWKVYYPLNPGESTLGQFNPGNAYYIEMNQHATWNIP